MLEPRLILEENVQHDEKGKVGVCMNSVYTRLHCAAGGIPGDLPKYTLVFLLDHSYTAVPSR